MLKTYIVIPTIRSLKFLSAWKNEFSNCHLIIIEDNQEKTIVSKNLKFKSVKHFSYIDIDKDFGKNSWIFSRKNAGIRSYGFWKAYKLGADVVLTLDDDCFPEGSGFVETHLKNLDQKMPHKWQATYPNPKWMNTRGFPYGVRDQFPVALSHGLWSGALDLDAKTEIKLPKLLDEIVYPPITQYIQFGSYYPMCSMNMAFKREITPLMFFPMMGEGVDGSKWPYNRYDDIWAGIFSKKIMDHLNLGVVNGSPFVDHRKASKPNDNHSKELSGMKMNETLWKCVDRVTLKGKTPKECYVELAKKIKFPKGAYFKNLKDAMIIWANLF